MIIRPLVVKKLSYGREILVDGATAIGLQAREHGAG